MAKTSIFLQAPYKHFMPITSPKESKPDRRGDVSTLNLIWSNMLLIHDFTWNLIAEVLSAVTKNRLFCVFKSHPVIGFLENNNCSPVVEVVFDEKDGPRWFEFFEKCDRQTNRQTHRQTENCTKFHFGNKKRCFLCVQLPPPSNDGEYKLSVESARTPPKSLNQLSSNASVSINSVFFVHFDSKLEQIC